MVARKVEKSMKYMYIDVYFYLQTAPSLTPHDC